MKKGFAAAGSFVKLKITSGLIYDLAGERIEGVLFIQQNSLFN